MNKIEIIIYIVLAFFLISPIVVSFQEYWQNGDLAAKIVTWFEKIKPKGEKKIKHMNLNTRKEIMKAQRKTKRKERRKQIVAFPLVKFKETKLYNTISKKIENGNEELKETVGIIVDAFTMLIIGVLKVIGILLVPTAIIFFSISIVNVVKEGIESDGPYDNTPTNWGPGYENNHPGVHEVNGYYRSDGTYVEPYLRTNPDGDPSNNFNQ